MSRASTELRSVRPREAHWYGRGPRPVNTDAVSWISIARSFYFFTVKGRDEGLLRRREHSSAAPRLYGVGGLLENPPVTTVTSMQATAIAATAG